MGYLIARRIRVKAKQIFRIILFWVLAIIGFGLILNGLLRLFQYDIIRELLIILGGFSAWSIASDVKIKED